MMDTTPLENRVFTPLVIEKDDPDGPDGGRGLNGVRAALAHRYLEHIQSNIEPQELRVSNHGNPSYPQDVDVRPSAPLGSDPITESTAAEVVPSDERTAPYKTSPLHAARLDADNFSTTSVQSNLFTHSWRRPGLYTVSDLCSYIASTPTTHINLLKWCKDRKGVKQEFLVLRVDRPQDKHMWLRLDRRLHQHAPVVDWIFSRSPTGDSAMLCDRLEPLFDSSRSKIKVETEFTIPPSLRDLGHLLSILLEMPAKFKISSENCYFFCSVIYTQLFAIGGGVNIRGTPGQFSMSLAPDVRAEVDFRFKSLLSKTTRKASSKTLGPQDTIPSSRDARLISGSPLAEDRSDVSRNIAQVRGLVPEMKPSADSAPHSVPRQTESAQAMGKFWQRMRARVPSRVEARPPDDVHGGAPMGPVTRQPRQISPLRALFSDAPPKQPPQLVQRKTLPAFDTVRDHPGNDDASRLMDGWGVYPRSMKMKATPDFTPPEHESRSSSVLVSAGQNTLPVKRRRPTIRREST